MTKYFSITRSAILAFLVSLVFMFLAAGLAHAQTASSSAQASAFGVTFPVAALGNCNSLAECKSFCDDPVNATSCINYAKSKGFYKEDALATSKETVLAKAKATLGCDSETSCLSFTA